MYSRSGEQCCRITVTSLHQPLLIKKQIPPPFVLPESRESQSALSSLKPASCSAESGISSLSHVSVKHKTEGEWKSQFFHTSSWSSSSLLFSKHTLERNIPGNAVRAPRLRSRTRAPACLPLLRRFAASTKPRVALTIIPTNSAAGRRKVGNKSTGVVAVMFNSHCGYMDSNYCPIRTEIELSLSCKHLNSNNCGPTTIRSTPWDNSVRVDW